MAGSRVQAIPSPPVEHARELRAPDPGSEAES
jgi:hypothetical protein